MVPIRPGHPPAAYHEQQHLALWEGVLELSPTDMLEPRLYQD
jgi:hypothetical protein